MSDARKLFAAGLLSLVVAIPASARIPGRYGVRGGVNLSAFSGELGDLIGPRPRVAPNVSFVYEYDFVPGLAFHAEAGWSGKGGQVSSEGTDQAGNPTGRITNQWRFEYLEVPLLVRTRMPAAGNVTPFLELGPSFGIKLSGRFETHPRVIESVELGDDMKPLDVGFGAGGGIEFRAGPGRLGVEARYTRGFSDLFDVAGNAESINQAWTIALAYTR
jgi:hypothetical protein